MRIPMRSLALIAVTGCGSYTMYQTAEPLPLNHWQLQVASTSGEFFDLPQNQPTPTTAVELASRYGIGHDTDVGLKIYTFGTEASVRHRFVNGKWQWAGLAALGGARTLERLGTTDALTMHVRGAAAITRRFRPRFAITFGPALTGSLFVPAGGGSSAGLLVGAFGNAEWRFGATNKWHLVPEISLHVAPLGDVPVKGGVILGGIAFGRDF